MKILISGTSSGIGKFLKKQFKSDAFDRKKNFRDYDSYDVIIHCAYNVKKNVDLFNIKEYWYDNIGLLKKILKIKHKKFVFFSSIDVYPQDNFLYNEKCPLRLEQPKDIYSISKIFCENILLKKEKCLIIRAGMMIGEYMRNNNIKKVLSNARDITLTQNSTFNCVSYDDIFRMIELSLKKNIFGTFNVAFTPNVTLGQLSKISNSKSKFGKFKYISPKICNKLFLKTFKFREKSSEEVIINYFKNIL